MTLLLVLAHSLSSSVYAQVQVFCQQPNGAIALTLTGIPAMVAQEKLAEGKTLGESVGARLIAGLHHALPHIHLPHHIVRQLSEVTCV
jgi:hypothetical protein